MDCVRINEKYIHPKYKMYLCKYYFLFVYRKAQKEVVVNIQFEVYR